MPEEIFEANPQSYNTPLRLSLIPSSSFLSFTAQAHDHEPNMTLFARLLASAVLVRLLTTCTVARLIVEQDHEANPHELEAFGFPSGMFLYRLTANESMQTRRMVVIRQVGDPDWHQGGVR